MELLAIVVSGFVVAPFAPLVCRALGRFAGWGLALLPLAITLLLMRLASEGLPVHQVQEWVPGLGVSLSFRLDGLSMLMTMLISGIGTIIFIYAGAYLAGHQQADRFYVYLLMFMASMLGIVLSDNLIALFVFWELTSITSYLLIGFDHASAKARKSALQALLVTGIGGLAILAAAVMLAMVAGTTEISELAERGEVIRSDPRFTVILLLLVFGAFTKSAQFPFHFWLPSAMAAPTPVSAYLHSSTMVKAGVYLLARLSPIFSGVALWHELLTWCGAVTMVVGAWLAYRQNVMKLLLAYSTVSALGAMVMGIGIGTTELIQAAMVALLAHALYKAALFMAAGAIDHETSEKDLTRLGGLGRAMPILASATIVASFSMAGLPPLFGFVSKEVAIESFLHKEHGGSLIALLVMFLAAAALGVAAALRMGFRPFLGERLEITRGAAEAAGPWGVHEPSVGMLLGPVFLAVVSLAAAFAPAVIVMPLVEPAVEAVLGRSAPFQLAMWHGVTVALGLSGAAVAVGLILLWQRRAVLAAARPMSALDAIGPARWYEAILAGVLAVATWQTRVLQNGSLRHYLFMTMGVTIAAVGGTMVFHHGFIKPAPIGEIRFYELGLIVLILAGVVFVATARTRLAAIAGLGMVGYGVALVFVLFGAPDLALTQLCVETLTVVLLVLVFYFLPDFKRFSTRRQKLRDLLIALVGGAMMTALVLLVTRDLANPAVSEFYAQNSLPAAHGRNVVNVILVDFRGIDTLGEITVLVLAAVGVVTLVKLAPKSEGTLKKENAR